jgi:hypothetical protein
MFAMDLGTKTKECRILDLRDCHDSSIFKIVFFWIDDEPIPPTILCTKAEAFVRRNSFLLQYIRRNAPSSIHQEIVVHRSTDRPTDLSKQDRRASNPNQRRSSHHKPLAFVVFHFISLCYVVLFRCISSCFVLVIVVVVVVVSIVFILQNSTRTRSFLPHSD